jgi:hypothetical protein
MAFPFSSVSSRHSYPETPTFVNFSLAFHYDLKCVTGLNFVFNLVSKQPSNPYAAVIRYLSMTIEKF